MGAATRIEASASHGKPSPAPIRKRIEGRASAGRRNADAGGWPPGPKTREPAITSSSQVSDPARPQRRAIPTLLRGRLSMVMEDIVI